MSAYFYLQYHAEQHKFYHINPLLILPTHNHQTEVYNINVIVSLFLDLRNPEYIRYMQRNYKPDFTYQQFAPQFTAELFNATQWALLFRDSGARWVILYCMCSIYIYLSDLHFRYVVLTSKHHDGYTLWPSKYSFGWNAMDVGPKRDIISRFISKWRNT